MIKCISSFLNYNVICVSKSITILPVHNNCEKQPMKIKFEKFRFSFIP